MPNVTCRSASCGVKYHIAGSDAANNCGVTTTSPFGRGGDPWADTATPSGGSSNPWGDAPVTETPRTAGEFPSAAAYGYDDMVAQGGTEDARYFGSIVHMPDGSEVYYRADKTLYDGCNPGVIRKDGQKEWFKDGEVRFVQRPDGSRLWKVDGKLQDVPSGGVLVQGLLLGFRWDEPYVDSVGIVIETPEFEETWEDGKLLYRSEEQPIGKKTAGRIAAGVPGYSAVPKADKIATSWADTRSTEHVDGRRPVNPVKRTGKTGLGECSFWGPNQCADPIVFRTAPDGSVEMMAIARGDTGEWAIPGGKLDPGESTAQAAARELKEEAGLDVDFGSAVSVSKGYVDDPRNTDNAWFESEALAVEVPYATSGVGSAGSDATAVTWVRVDDDMALYADHKQTVLKAKQLLFGN